MARIKGVGLEVLYQPSNSIGYNIVTGNGKFGAGIISSAGENNFFGNRPIEIDEIYLERRINEERYQNNKINFSLASTILNKKNYNLDFGLTFKRNPEIKVINTGFGFSGKISFLNFGFSLYRDDVKFALGQYKSPYSFVEYSKIYNRDFYQESFNVQAFSVGTKINNLAIDFGLLKTKYIFYPEQTLIRIYSTSYRFKKILLNLAFRNEHSSNLKEVKNQLIYQASKKDIYGGIQYFINSNLTIGFSYNHFLLNEYSGTMTLFF